MFVGWLCAASAVGRVFCSSAWHIRCQAAVVDASQSGESPPIQGKARPCFCREAGSEEEGTVTQPNSLSKEASSSGDYRSNTLYIADYRCLRSSIRY
ncbi:hypothetical protein Trydic_g2564 [Trypoxylus dichotomus]